MSATANVVVRATGDTEGAVQGIQSVSASAVAMGNIMADLAKGALRMVGEAFTGAIDAGKEWIQFANVQEDAEKKLDASLRAAGQNVQLLSGHYRSLASHFQEVSKVADEALLPLMGQLVTVGGVQADQMERATALTLDFARANKLSLETAFLAVSKAAAGNVAPLARYGLEVEGTGDKTADFANLLDVMASKFEGFAEDEAQTFSGRMEDISNTTGDTKEILGGMIKDVLLPLLPIVKEAGEALQKFIVAHKPEIVTEFSAALATLIRFWAEIIAVGGAVVETWGAIRTKFAELLLTLKPVIDLMIRFEEMLGNEPDLLRDLSAGLEMNVQDQQALQASIRETVDTVNEHVSQLENGLIVQLDKLAEENKRVEKTQTQLNAERLEAIRTEAMLQDEMAKTAGATKEVSDAAAKAAQALGLMTQEEFDIQVRDLAGGMKLLADQVGEADPRFKEAQKKLAALFAEGTKNKLVLPEGFDAAKRAAREMEYAAQMAGRATEEAGKKGAEGTAALENGAKGAAQAVEEVGEAAKRAGPSVVTEFDKQAEAARAAAIEMNHAAEAQNAMATMSMTIGGRGQKGDFAGIAGNLQAGGRMAGAFSATGQALTQGAGFAASGDSDALRALADVLRSREKAAGAFGSSNPMVATQMGQAADKMMDAARLIDSQAKESAQAADKSFREMKALGMSYMNFVPASFRSQARQMLNAAQGFEDLPDAVRGAAEKGDIAGVISALKTMMGGQTTIQSAIKDGLKSFSPVVQIDTKAIAADTAAQINRSPWTSQGAR